MHIKVQRDYDDALTTRDRAPGHQVLDFNSASAAGM